MSRPQSTNKVSGETGAVQDRGSVLLYIPLSAVDEQSTSVSDKEKGGFECFYEGKMAAKHSVSTGGSAAGGFLGGIVLGLIGTGIAVVVQSEPTPSYTLLPDGDSDCKFAFTQGYGEVGKSRKRSAALVGGLAGTLILVVVLVAANSD